MVIGLVIVAALVGVIGFWSSRGGGETTKKPLPFGADEQSYAQRIEFTDIKMSRAANFLDQEVTIIFGRVQNRGPRPIREMEVEVEFRNFQDRVVLSEKRRPFDPGQASLGGGFSREFQMNFEKVPADWNQQYPAIRVTGLALE
jgi:hypothetical protein